MPSLSGRSQTGVPRATLAEKGAPHQEDTAPPKHLQRLGLRTIIRSLTHPVSDY